MAKHRNNPNFAFWKMLKEGYDNFEATKLEPKVAVCEQRYVFNPDTDGKTFNPRGKCPAYRLDQNVAEAVLDYRRHEEFKMASYIAQNIATAPAHVGDGGSNVVFAAAQGTQEFYDNNGRLMQAAIPPGALPKIANPPGTTIPRPPAETQVATARPASRPVAAPASAPEKTEVALRGTNTDLAAKPKPAATVAKATVPASSGAPVVRTADSTATADQPSSSLLAGAQPMMPAGSFASRWSGLR